LAAVGVNSRSRHFLVGQVLDLTQNVSDLTRLGSAAVVVNSPCCLAVVEVLVVDLIHIVADVTQKSAWERLVLVARHF